MLVFFPQFLLFLPQICIEFILLASYGFQNKDIGGEKKSKQTVEVDLKKKNLYLTSLV